MAGPTLTPEQKLALQKQKQALEDALAAYQRQLAERPAKEADLLARDAAYAAQFDFYNSNLIGSYDEERKNIDGTYTTSPILESELKDVAENLNVNSRLYPPVGTGWDIVRVQEFDGGGTSVDPDNELAKIQLQAEIEDLLVNGAPNAPTLTATTQTASSLAPSSTSLLISDASGTPSFSVGQFFVVTGSGTAALVEVTSATNTDPAPAPTAWTLGIRVVVAPSGTIASGAPCTTFTSGFSDTDRTNKTTSEQALMDQMIAQLETYLAGRISLIGNQISALSGNLDELAEAENAIALQNANDSLDFLTNYLLTTDISDSGLLALDDERVDRGAYLIVRLSEISVAYTNPNSNYYDQRYIWANMRANLFNGSLRLLKVLEESEETVNRMLQVTEDSLNALKGLV